MEQLVDSNNVEDFNYSFSGLAANITAELILPESGEQLSHGDEGFGGDGDCVKVTYASACVKLGCGDLDHHVNLSRADICIGRNTFLINFYCAKRKPTKEKSYSESKSKSAEPKFKSESESKFKS